MSKTLSAETYIFLSQTKKKSYPTNSQLCQKTKFSHETFGFRQIFKVKATYTFEQFYLIESRLCVVRSALDHLEGDKFLVTEKKEETFLVSNTARQLATQLQRRRPAAKTQNSI